MRFGIFVLISLVVGAAYWFWDSTHHDHGGEHGPPLTIAAVEEEMLGIFKSEDGSGRVVEKANCFPGESGTGDEPNSHFKCFLNFRGGTADDVTVHVRADGLWFKAGA